MGRPIHPKYFGETYNNVGEIIDDTRLSAIVKVGINDIAQNGKFIKQRTNTTFIVEDELGNRGECELVDKLLPEDDEMVLVGVVNGEDTIVNIRKLADRTMYDFDNNRYKWELQNDSSENTLVLFKV